MNDANDANDAVECPTVGIFFASNTGTTESIVERMAMMLKEIDSSLRVEVLNVKEFYIEEMQDFDWLLIGVPTWNHGQLPRDWEAVFDEFDEVSLRGKRAALFGLGDQVGYPDTFGDALFFLADKLRARGAHLCGCWPRDGYSFNESWALENGVLLGLLIDEINQPDLTESRLHAWLNQVLQEFRTPLLQRPSLYAT